MNKNEFDKLVKAAQEAFDAKQAEVDEKLEELIDLKDELEKYRDELLNSLNEVDVEDEEDEEDSTGSYVFIPEYSWERDDPKEKSVEVYYTPEAAIYDGDNVSLAFDKDVDPTCISAALACALAMSIKYAMEKNGVAKKAANAMDVEYAAKEAVRAIGRCYSADTVLGAFREMIDVLDKEDDDE